MGGGRRRRAGGGRRRADGGRRRRAGGGRRAGEGRQGGRRRRAGGGRQGGRCAGGGRCHAGGGRQGGRSAGGASQGGRLRRARVEAASGGWRRRASLVEGGTQGGRHGGSRERSGGWLRLAGAATECIGGGGGSARWGGRKRHIRGNYFPCAREVAASSLGFRARPRHIYFTSPHVHVPAAKVPPSIFPGSLAASKISDFCRQMPACVSQLLPADTLLS
ncbi:hypothetical protein BRADI_2g31907v3 [Brachypodium distachyon]|uniref:Uncharacterized protein n=1 Tax=Brachypodium distachyon TaxID=15368 RepID=A0A0Q3K7Y2_BRADI|nr:hypothetical protein BRADI_2g31907v3 [Brachypodium distachyon]